MNRREFLFSLLSVPFGWKALFKKGTEKVDVLRGIGGFTWSAETGYLGDEVTDEWLREGYAEIEKEPYCVFQGLDRIINTGREDADVLPQCNIEWQIGYGQCEGSDLLEMDGERDDDADVVTGPISNLRDWGNESHNPFPGMDGSTQWVEEVCRILTEIVERDVPGMLLEGSVDITWDPPNAYIVHSDGSHFRCSNIGVDKTIWYRRIEIPNPYGGPAYAYTWESV